MSQVVEGSIVPRKIQRYGWHAPLPNPHKVKFKDYHAILTSFPKTGDLRPLCPPIYDQSTIGSCVAHGTGGLIQFLQMKEKIPNYVPSRLFIYYNARMIEGTTNSDSGSSVADGVRAVRVFGCPPEKEWWYNVNAFTVKPSKNVYVDGKKLVAGEAYSVDNSNINALKTCLFQGFPVVGGFTVYESFESDAVAKSGVVNMPGKHENAVGGHCILVVGWNDDEKRFIVRNSWGKWGLNQSGYFTIPYDYFTNTDLASDFWTIRNLVAH